MSAWRETASLGSALVILVVSVSTVCTVVAASLSGGYGPGCLAALALVAVAQTILALSILACGDAADCLRASIAGLVLVAVSAVASSDMLGALGIVYVACAGMAYLFRPDTVRTAEANLPLRRQA